MILNVYDAYGLTLCQDAIVVTYVKELECCNDEFIVIRSLVA